MNKKQTAWIFTVGILFFLLPSILMANIVPDKEIVYKTINNVELKLHVFEPQNHKVSDKKPVIIFFFGGGWTGGSPKQFYEQAQYLSQRGIVAISAEYRVKNPHNTTPFECVKDAKSAIRWVRQHSAELGVNPEQIIASGGSAGGHIACCTGLIIGNEEEGEDLSISSIPNAMILFNPVLDTTEKGYGMKKVGVDRKTEISPCHQVRAGIVPTLLFHGTADKTVPFENAQRFTKLMKDSGNICILKDFEGADHGFFNGSFFQPNRKDAFPYFVTIENSISFLTNLGYL
jgi:acetyl esterase/lipase